MGNTPFMHAYERVIFLLLVGTFGLFFMAFVLGVIGAVFTLNPGVERALRARLALAWVLCEDMANDLLTHTDRLLSRALRYARDSRQRAGLRILRRS